MRGVAPHDDNTDLQPPKKLPSTEVQSESTGVHGSPFVVPLARPQDSVLHLIVGGRVPNIVYVRRAVAGSRAVVIAALRTMGDERF